VPHPLLNCTDIDASLKMHCRKGRPEFVKEPIVAASSIGTGAVAVFAVAAVQFGTECDFFAKV
jgi:hypothetical protein